LRIFSWSRPTTTFRWTSPRPPGRSPPSTTLFLVSEDEFNAAFARIRGQDLPYWADPGQSQPAAINHRDGGRGLYFEDPDGHLLEIITRRYGSGR
jgi:catechol 2,3-dioxygenase-like lactoylglutathione lyase family enzyme